MIDNDGLALRVVEVARGLIGIKYSTEVPPHSQTPQTGFSCWGLVCYDYRKAGFPIPEKLDRVRKLLRSSFGDAVSELDDLEAGDILMLRRHTSPLPKGLPSHSGIYLGNGNVIHSTRATGIVCEWHIDKMMERYTFLGARRINGTS